MSSPSTLYIRKDSCIQRLHPFTKLSYILLTGVAVYVGPPGWMFDLLLLSINLTMLGIAGVAKEGLQLIIRIMLPLLLFMIPIHGFLHPDNYTVLFNLSGIHFYLEGLVVSLTTLMQLTVVLLTSLLFVLTTHPADLISAVSQTGKSPSLAYILGSPFLLLADMRERVNTIQAAQRARGLNTDGNFIRRFYSLAPLVMPLVVGAIIETEQRSIALEVRGFKSGNPKTFFRRIDDSKSQRFARWMMLAIAFFLTMYRLAW